MATLSQTLAKLPRLVEAEVTLPASSSVVPAINLPANCLVLTAGIVVTELVAGSTEYDIDLEVDTSVIAEMDAQGAELGDIIGDTVGGYVPVGTKVANTLDIDATVVGTATAGKVRVWALVVDMTAPRVAAEVDRDVLA